jgi:aminoglycoside phosphotransferase family enzyme/predicted kinase
MTTPEKDETSSAEGLSHVVADQSEVLAWLAAPETYGTGVRAVERIDTHGAIVFLAGDRAYKIKRAVKYPYMDFSTLARRQAACEREVALNRRTAPDLYLAAEPIVRMQGGILQIGGPGETVEWLVLMRRFDQDGLCDRLAQRGLLTPALARALAEEVAGLHDAAEVLSLGDAKGGGAAGMRAVIDENAAEFAERPDLFPGASDLAEATARALDTVKQQLDTRIAAGLVRRCHGDLHLRNICVIDGRPTIFDCIEFNDAIACIDVFYDLAFLLMDLEHRDLRPLANLVLNRYLELRDDIGGLAALPLFLSVRAAVRAKVSISMADIQSEKPATDKLHAEARAYMAEAKRYLTPAAPRLVAIGGLSGTGKTTLARELAPKIEPAPGALHLRSDVLRKRLAGVDELKRLPPESYTPEANAQVYATLIERARAALNAGHSVIVDAVYAKPQERAAIEDLARACGAPFAGIWLEAPQATLIARVTQRRGDASDATAPVVRAQQAYDLGEISWTRVDASAGLSEMAAQAGRVIETDQATAGYP